MNVKKEKTMIKRSALALFIIFSFSCYRIAAQDVNIIGGGQLDKPIQTTAPDTIPLLELDETELEKIPDLRSQFEKLNSSYTSPAEPSENVLQFLTKDEVKLSPEAQYWVDWVRDPATVISPWMTLRDTCIVNPLFTPILFKGGLIPEDLQLYDKDFFTKQRPDFSLFKPDTTLFEEEIIRGKLQDMAYNYVRVNYPEYFRYSERDLPTDVVATHEIKKATYEPSLIKIENNDPNAFNDVDAPVKFIPERRYWTSHFESSVQFAQNYISPNWHKGGVSALNLTNRQYFVYNYNKNKIQVTNELEWKTNVLTAPKDTLRDYKIGDDVLRLHSNIGYKAFSKWFYTFDATFQTQLFSNFAENTDNKLASFLAPFNVNIGVGMKYELNKTFPKSRHKKVGFSVNLAPISYDMKYSINKDIDLGRHGFQKPEGSDTYNYKLHKFGSTINSTLNFQFNRNVSWYSRFYYFTNYESILGEFENRLTMAISRFFSTTISLHLRYDDSVAKREDFNSRVQINELLSFGFNYKW